LLVAFGDRAEFSSGQGSSGPAKLGCFSGQRSEFRVRVQFFIRFSVQVAMGGNALRWHKDEEHNLKRMKSTHPYIVESYTFLVDIWQR